MTVYWEHGWYPYKPLYPANCARKTLHITPESFMLASVKTAGSSPMTC